MSKPCHDQTSVGYLTRPGPIVKHREGGADVAQLLCGHCNPGNFSPCLVSTSYLALLIFSTDVVFGQ
jgi:hypothetical protein